MGLGLLDEVINADERVIRAVGAELCRADAEPQEQVRKKSPETGHLGTGYPRIPRQARGTGWKRFGRDGGGALRPAEESYFSSRMRMLRNSEASPWS